MPETLSPATGHLGTANRSRRSRRLLATASLNPVPTAPAYCSLAPSNVAILVFASAWASKEHG